MEFFLDPGNLSNLAGALMFLILSILLLVNWRGQLIGGLLLLASALSSIWFWILVIFPDITGLSLIAQLVEVARDAAWLIFLITVLMRQSEQASMGDLVSLRPFVYGLPILLTLLLVYLAFSGNTYLPLIPGVRLDYVGFIATAFLGLLLLEKLYRSTNPESRWGLKFLCFGIGGIFIYDLFLYSNALMISQIETYLLDARGAINAICVPLIAVSVARNPDWKMELYVSRHVVYHSTAALAAGIYLVAMAFAGYYVKLFGGEWGPSLQIIFFFGAVVILIILFFSTDMRARLRIFLAKHFYKNKYDYREEWLGFARSLADNQDNQEIYRTIIKSVASVVKSPGGALWLQDKDGRYVFIDEVALYDKLENEIMADEEFIKFMNDCRWIIDLEEYQSDPGKYKNISLPQWITTSNRIWLIMPLFNRDSLSGFMVIIRPHGNASFNWEDIDLLKTVGFQTVAYIDLLRTSEALSEARQFETFNRLAAFMVHDIKNVIAQLTLVTSNFEKFKGNPDFVSDAMETIEHAANKMKLLIGYLGKDQVIHAASPQKFDLAALLEEIINERKNSKPEPVLRQSISGIIINSEKDKLASALEHLVQNAQDATDESGNVWLALKQQDGQARITIGDDGCGMDEVFIKTRLFKPFDTTKGNAGMGIGVYESREIIHSMGGSIQVESQPGEGTVFTISIPCHIEENDMKENKIRMGN